MAPSSARAPPPRAGTAASRTNWPGCGAQAPRGKFESGSIRRRPRAATCRRPIGTGAAEKRRRFAIPHQPRRAFALDLRLRADTPAAERDFCGGDARLRSEKGLARTCACSTDCCCGEEREGEFGCRLAGDESSRRRLGESVGTASQRIWGGCLVGLNVSLWMW